MRVLCILCLLVHIAAADPRVLVVETRGSPDLPTLASQLELHVAARASIVVEREPGIDPLTFADRASRRVAARDASVVVWLAPVDRGYVVFAAGSWPGRALIELVHIDGALDSTEIERTIALKIAGLVDALLATPEPSTSKLALGLAPPVRDRWWTIEVAGVLARESFERGVDGRTSLAIGHVWRRDRWSVSPQLGGYWQPSGVIDAMAGRVSVVELGASAGVELAHDVGTFGAFVRPQFVMATMLARGASTDGRQGEATLVAPYASIEVGARRLISSSAWLGLVGGVDVATIRHELQVDGQTVVDLGRVRLHVGLVLMVGL
ncbi:MAG: hypothetical protein ACKV2T_00570 [Kofleriaceae bacterium]